MKASTTKRGFTLNRLLVVIAIIGILAAMVLPTLSRSKGKAQLVYCKNNERQMAIALMCYVHDTGYYPGSRGIHYTTPFWFQKLQPYTRNGITDPLYDCPGFHFDRELLVKNGYSLEAQRDWLWGEYDYNRWGTIRGGDSTAGAGGQLDWDHIFMGPVMTRWRFTPEDLVYWFQATWLQLGMRTTSRSRSFGV
jgi:type II secretory pathway pseudopilin PulG